MSVSILIPGFRPTFLRQTIASALAQGPDDFEIVISDDSGGEDLLPVVEQFRDPRIRYLRTAGRIGAAENCLALWEACRTERMLFLFDDDLLLPNAIVDLADALDAHPGSAFSFGPRHVIDAAGRLIREATPPGGASVFTGDGLAAAIVGSVTNHIGELSNVLIDRSIGLTMDDLAAYEGAALHVVTDVGFFLNASRKGPAVRAPRPVAAFRRHEAQNSQPSFNPRFAIGIAEWELFIRGEYDRGRLPRDAALKAIDKLATAYVNWGRKLPALARLQPGLAALRDRVEAGRTEALDAAFRAAWDDFVAEVLGKPS